MYTAVRTAGKLQAIADVHRVFGGHRSHLLKGERLAISIAKALCKESSWVYNVAHESDVENERRAIRNGVSRRFLPSRAGAAAACDEGGGQPLRTGGGSRRQDPAAEGNGGAAVLDGIDFDKDRQSWPFRQASGPRPREGGQPRGHREQGCCVG